MCRLIFYKEHNALWPYAVVPNPTGGNYSQSQGAAYLTGGAVDLINAQVPAITVARTYNRTLRIDVFFS